MQPHVQAALRAAVAASVLFLSKSGAKETEFYMERDAMGAFDKSQDHHGCVGPVGALLEKLSKEHECGIQIIPPSRRESRYMMRVTVK